MGDLRCQLLLLAALLSAGGRLALASITKDWCPAYEASQNVTDTRQALAGMTITCGALVSVALLGH